MRLVCFPKRTVTNAGRNFWPVGRIVQTPKRTTLQKAAFIQCGHSSGLAPTDLDGGLLRFWRK